MAKDWKSATSAVKNLEIVYVPLRPAPDFGPHIQAPQPIISEVMETGTTVIVAPMGDQRVAINGGNLPFIGLAKKIITYNKEEEEYKEYVKEKREFLVQKQ
ncbi:hypothetical protein V6N13_063933 [Hibiscus sabdariffa]|uniref:Uncharacterized protein n=1 Tax=Hibiscus sabdariffa TaxID=183260 RepID=A0ABR2R1K8_9ROSI